MKKQELRIGNLVLDKDDKVFSIYGILENSILIKDAYIGMPIEWIKPIQLTEEWILNFGFTKQKVTKKLYSLKNLKSKTWFSLWEVGDYVDPNELTFKEPKIWYSFDNNNYDVKIKFVHQLQNLYFALTGEELILKTK